jgi:hypothetical protein
MEVQATFLKTRNTPMSETPISPLRGRMIEMLWGRGGEGVAPSARYEPTDGVVPCVSQTT